MGDLTFLRDLALVLTAAAAAAVLCQALKQPKAIGYILAGLILGGLGIFRPLIADQKSIHTIADLGLIFMMFSMGMDFNLRKLRNVGVSALAIALVDVAVMVTLGFLLGRLLGWNAVESIFLGAIICDSSTAVMTKMVGDLAMKKELFAHVILGASIIEDLLAIVLITLLTGIGMTGNIATGLVFGKIGALMIFMIMLLIVGLLVLPRLIDGLSRFRDDELLTIAVIGICFGVSLLSITLDFSLALGAFIVGGIMAEARQRGRLEMLTGPMRDVFGAVFFVAIGLMVHLNEMVRHPGVLLLLVAAVIVGKFLGCGTTAFLTGNDRPTSVRIGCGMAQVNEFALIIASLGIKMGTTRDFVYALAVGISLLTTFASPYLIKNAGAIDGWLEAALPQRARRALARYTARSGRRGEQQGELNPIIVKTIQRSLLIILINMAWIAGLFIVAAYAAARLGRFAAAVPGFLGGPNAAFWFAAALLTVPFVVANLRKMRALAMIASEIRFPRDMDHPRYAIPRLVTEWVLTGGGVIAMLLVILFFGSTVLPPQRTLAAMGVIIVVLAAIFWKFNIRIYSKAQVALREVFTGNQSWLNLVSPNSAQEIFSEAHLVDTVIATQSPAANKMIRDLNLRATSGVIIIGLEREGNMAVSPAADEVLMPGDRIYMLGTGPQLEKARHLIVG